MFWGGGADEDERYARLGDRGEGQSDSGAGEILVKLSIKNFDYPEKPLKYKHIRRISD